MTRIADLLDRDFSKPIEETVEVANHDPDTVFTELAEYVATDRLKAEYERLFSAMAAAAKSPHESVGVWISGFFGAGKSSFVKNLGYVLANREVRGASSSVLFLKQLASQRVAECVEFLNRAVPCEIFMFDIHVELPPKSNMKPIAEVMYRVLRRDLDYAEDYHIGELEMALEKAGKLAAFQDLCRVEYKEEWRKIRNGGRKLARCSALLQRFDPRTYASRGAWLNMVKAGRSRGPSVEESVERLFELCEIRRPGKAFVFVVDELGEYAALGAARLENLRAVVEQFGKQSVTRMRAGKIPGPAWIVGTAHETLAEYCNRVAAGGTDLPKLQNSFKHRIDLSSAGIGEVAARRVLSKRESGKEILQKLFREHGAALMQNTSLRLCKRRTEFDEDEFVRFYPYLPHFIDISIDATTGIRMHPDAPNRGGNRSMVKQAFEMLVSDRTRLAEQPVGALVSIDKIYELVEGNIPAAKRRDIVELGRRFDGDRDYPGLASRVVKAMCLMEFAKADLLRTTENIAALLIQRVTEAPPILAVAAILHHMRDARFVRWTIEGWTVHDFYELRLVAATLVGFENAIGVVNPRLPGWRNDLIQIVKRSLARSLTWYTRPLHKFIASVSRSLEEIVWSFDRLSSDMVPPGHISAHMAAVDQLSMDIVALERRLALSEKRNAMLAESMQVQLEHLHEQTPVDERTAYVIGLFGTGRRYINELILENIGERARYFRDTIRLHPGPTPMIYSGHATMRHVSRFQEPPQVMRRILEAVGAGFADSIFVYRHPLDSLLTNWIWWRTYLRDNRWIAGISQIYRNTGELSADLEQNFLEFKSFADGDPEFFARVRGEPFLSFQEFVEETELHFQSATLALRLEDFMIDPREEFSKIVEVMSVGIDVSRASMAAPRTKPYGYLAVKDKVPRFKDYIDGLDAGTKRRLERLGYDVEGRAQGLTSRHAR
jgi:hypothetical protein